MTLMPVHISVVLLIASQIYNIILINPKYTNTIRDKDFILKELNVNREDKIILKV